MKKRLLNWLCAVLALTMMFSMVGCNKKTTQLIFGRELIKTSSQMLILSNLATGAADVGVMDSVMANYYMNQGEFAGRLQLVDGLVLAEEFYGIAAKKGSKGLMNKINKALIDLSGAGVEGGVDGIAKDYNLDEELVVTPATENPLSSTTETASWDDIVRSGKVIVGYTLFAPIAFEDNGSLTGFDVELAKKVFEKINADLGTNVRVDFQLITWSQKEAKLENGEIDLIWNGLTITEERKSGMEIGIPYLRNEQAAIIRKADAAKYGNFSSFIQNAYDAVVAVESSSAAQYCMEVKK